MATSPVKKAPTKGVIAEPTLAATSVALPADPEVPAARYAVTPVDLTAGRNCVLVENRGEARVEKHVTVGVDPYGGILVTFENGVSCAFENDPKTIRIIGRALTPIEPWQVLQNPDEQWISLYVGKGGLACRVYSDGAWNAYSGRGDPGGWAEGRGANLEDGKKQAIESLRAFGADVSVLE